jgi:hypothetical protein
MHITESGEPTYELNHRPDQLSRAIEEAAIDAEWRDWEHVHNVKGKSPRYLARRAHWLMDGLDPDRCQVIVHLVPPPARLVIVHGFARSYRRACAAQWGAELPVGPARASLSGAAARRTA